MAGGTPEWPMHKKCEALHYKAAREREKAVPKESGCLTVLALLLMTLLIVLLYEVGQT
jgi:hypothetical protein